MRTTRASKRNKVAKKLRPIRTQVSIQYAVPRRGVPSAAFLRRWAIAPVTLRIVGEAEGRRLNRAFRKKNYATNVLSFHGGDIVLAYRWADGGQGSGDNVLHVGYQGLGIQSSLMGDFDDLTFLRTWGVQNSILYLARE